MVTRASKNYRDGALPPLQASYTGFAFAFDNSVERAGKRVGQRIFPGDDTPRTFTECNLVNCIVPPGSTIVDCNTSILERNISTARPGRRAGTLEVECLIHGHYNPATLRAVYKATPKRVLQDR